jgi:hypothetical protein
MFQDNYSKRQRYAMIVKFEDKGNVAHLTQQTARANHKPIKTDET